MYFKIAIGSKMTYSHCAQWRKFPPLQNGTQYVDKYSKPVTHIIEVNVFLFVISKFNIERNFGPSYFVVDMMWTECLKHRITCSVNMIHLCYWVALDVFVFVCVATIEWWGYSTRCVAVVWAKELCFDQRSLLYLQFSINSYEMQRTARKSDFLRKLLIPQTRSSVLKKRKKNLCSLQMHKNQSLLPIVSQMNPFHIVPLYFWKIPFNLILYGPCIILQYICNPTRYTIFDD